MKKKILIIIGSLNLGGTEKQLLNVIKYLKDRFEFEICLLTEKGILFNDFKKLGIKVRTNNLKRRNTKVNFFFYYSFLPFYLYKSVRQFNPSIVHFYLPQAYILGGFLSFLFPSKKFIMSRRSMNFYQKKYPTFLKKFEIFLHKKMDLILGNSRAVCKQLINEEKVDKRNCFLVHNGIKIVDNLIKVKKKKIVIVCIANFIPYKNHEMLVKACLQLPTDLDWEVRLIGKDNHRIVNKLRGMLEKSIVKKRIIFVNQQINLESFLKSADIGVLTSDEEGFSNSILEYMNYSLPVIATNVGGNMESVIDNKNGFLVEKNNEKELSNKLDLLIRNKDLRKKMGKKSKEFLIKNFSINKCVQKYEKIYELSSCYYEHKNHNFDVSVIIPHYNDSLKIKTAIKSALSQTIRPKEIIIIDDFSSKFHLKKLKILEKHLRNKNIKFIYHTVNSGACFCRNLGFKEAKSSYIALLDSDDFWKPDKVEKQVSYMNKFDLDFSCTSFEITSVFKKENFENQTVRFKEDVFKKDILWGCFLSPGSTAIIKKNFLMKNKLFQNEKLRRLEDWHWLIEIEKKTQIKFLDESLSIINVTKKPSFELIESSVEIFKISIVKHEKNLIYKLKYLSSLHLEKSSAALYSDLIRNFLFYGFLGFLVYPFRNFNFFKRSFSLIRNFYFKKSLFVSK